MNMESANAWLEQLLTMKPAMLLLSSLIMLGSYLIFLRVKLTYVVIVQIILGMVIYYPLAKWGQVADIVPKPWVTCVMYGFQIGGAAFPFSMAGGTFISWLRKRQRAIEANEPMDDSQPPLPPK